MTQPTRSPSETAAFSGSVPRAYNERLVPILFEEYARDLCDRTGPIEAGAVLETAAGTGAVTRRLRERLPASTRLVATDISPDMLEVNRAAAGPGAVEYLAADACDLPFDAASFDAVVCQFGVMFFPDEARGYCEAARVLRPGGRFLFNVWDELSRNPFAACVHEACRAAAPADPARFLETPYRPLDLTTIVRNLEAAGFDRVSATVLRRPCRAGTVEHAADAFLLSSPLGRQVAERGQTEAVRAEVRRALAERFTGGDLRGQVVATMQAVVVEAARAR